jgi:hypothetical protein
MKLAFASSARELVGRRRERHERGLLRPATPACSSSPPRSPTTPSIRRSSARPIRASWKRRRSRSRARPLRRLPVHPGRLRDGLADRGDDLDLHGGQTTSWTHQFDLADAIDGLGVTVAIDKQLYVEELTSAKVHGFELTQADNGAMNMTYKVLGSKPTNISSVNINSTLAGATYPRADQPRRAAAGRLPDEPQLHGALASTDAIKAESIKFTFTRPQDAPHVYGQDFVDEPADNGWPEVMVEVQYPRMNTPSANSLYAGLRSATAFKADWTFLGAFINSTDQYKKLYQFPYLQLMDDGFSAPTAGAQQVKPVAKFAARLAPTSPTGMAFIRPFRLTRTMTQSVVAF